MDMKFLLDIVATRGFIFSSYAELSKILSDRFSQTLQSKVKITNERGQTLHGNVISDNNVIENIKSLKSTPCSYGFATWCSWSTEFKTPFTPSQLKKRNGVEWYLIYYSNGRFGVTHSTEINELHYLLAELIPGDSGFETAKGCKIEID